jgi:integrase
MAEGVEVRKLKNGRKSYRASVWSPEKQKLIRKSFPTMAAAKSWRRDAAAEVEAGTIVETSSVTVREAAAELIEGAKSGAIRSGSRSTYKPSTIRGYRQVLDRYILPDLGDMKLQEIRVRHVQALIDDLLGQGLSGSTIRNALDPLRVIYRRAIVRELVTSSPMTNALEIPQSDGKRERVADVVEAEALIAAVPAEDRGLWATAMYAGLRRGELRALRVQDIDMVALEIHVERSWDSVEGPIDPKSKAGRRTVSIYDLLRGHLADHMLLVKRQPQGLVFGRTESKSFSPSAVSSRAKKAWKAAGLNPITLHECRHSAATLMIHAGANPKTIQNEMGHASIQITFDRYGHLFRGSRAELKDTVNRYLADQLAASR